jgi:hypothetical protein
MSDKTVRILLRVSIIVIAVGCALFNNAVANDTGCLEVGEVGNAGEDIACCNGTEPL